MAKRKTILVAEIIEMVNRRNHESTCSPETREGWNSLLEEILFKTNQYKGFRSLQQNEVPADQKPGIIPGLDENGDRDNTKNSYPDETRRVY